MNKINPLNNLEINDVFMNRIPNEEKGIIEEVLGIEWSSDAGFGRYELIISKKVDGEGRPISSEDDKICGYSEFMDKGEHKEFLRALLSKLADKVTIIE